MTLPAIISSHTVTFYIDGKPYQASASMPNFEAVKDELRKADPDTDLLIRLVTPAEAIRASVAAAVEASPDYLPAGKVSVTRTEIRYDGQPVNGVLVDRILAMLADGFDIMPMVRFMENLFRNPADHAREELYLWLESANLPITEDGHFLAYKLVNTDFTSIHDGRTDNTPGKVVSMPRHAVDPVRDNVCSSGLHFCSKDYLPSFGYGGAHRVVVLLKINPADVVSIPSDYQNTKGRAWQYEVLQQVDFDPMQKVWGSLVSSDGSDVEDDDDDDDSYDDDDYDYYADYTDEDADEEVTPDTDKADEVTRIHELGIIELRREASQKGLVGAWKGKSALELRTYLIGLL